jgi:hypothetical protein
MRDDPPPQPAAPGAPPVAPPAGVPSLSMYARVSCLEQPVPRDITEYWADPVSYFLIRGGHCWSLVPTTVHTTHPCRGYHPRQLPGVVVAFMHAFPANFTVCLP